MLNFKVPTIVQFHIGGDVYIERSVSRMGAFVPLANFLNLFLQLNGVLGDPEPFRSRRTAQVGAFEQFGAGLFSKSLIMTPRLEAFMLFSSAARLMDLQRIIS